MPLIAVCVALSALVSAARVKNVPYHRQITEFSCGDASMEMLLHWTGMDVDQRAIIDALRTGPHAGTLRCVSRNLLFTISYQHVYL